MIGIIEIDEKDVSDDGYIYVILEYPIERKNAWMQPCIRVKTNLKLIEWVGVSGRGVVSE